MKIMLLGVGMQGKAALHDLVQSADVSRVVAADIDGAALDSYVRKKGYGSKVESLAIDAAQPGMLESLLSAKCDAVIDLLPVRFSGKVAAAAVQHGVHLVNSVYPLPAVQQLAAAALHQGVTILPEFGLDPGIDLVLLGEAVRTLDRVDEITTYGAGFPEPKAAKNPLKYKVTWTFDGVLRSYRRASRVIRSGHIIDITDCEQFNPKHIHTIQVPGLGRMEAFPNGDSVKYAEQLGLDPTKLRHMGRYTLRWPGHCEFWKKLVDLHLLDDEPLTLGEVSVNKRRFLAAAIEPHIRLGEQERDVIIIRIEVKGRKDGKKKHLLYQIIDRRDLQTGLTAMSRTVGFTASIGAQLIASGRVRKRGILSPVCDIPYELFKKELFKRGIRIRTKIT